MEPSGAELEAVYPASPLGILVTDTEFRWVRMNRAYKEITGLSEEEASGTGHQRAIHPDDREELAQNRRERDPDKGTFEIEHRLLLKDGTVKWVRVIVTPIWSGETRVGWIGTLEDITTSCAEQLALQESEERFRAISADASQKTIESFKRASVVDSLTKPIDVDQLLSLLDRLSE